MTEGLIKTGIQLKIENECGLLTDESEWVSLSLLKELINNEIKTIDEQTLSMHEFGARDALRWVVTKLLEEPKP